MGKSKTHRRKSSNAPRTVEPAVEPASLFDAHFWLAPLIAFASLLVLYIATLAPSVVGGDSGELTAAALTGGVPHPPGYPLFAILARVFAAFPFGPSPAWRVNLLSATSTAAAGCLLCAFVQLWIRNKVAALVATALFGTNTMVWLHATSAEVFGLNTMFIALAFFLWLGVERTASRRFVFALAFASGLAMCNHHIFVFVGFPLFLRSLWVARRSLRVPGIAIAVAVGALGLAPYAYLPALSASSAAVSWGDLSTFDGFITHFLRRNYGTFSMGMAFKGGGFTTEGTFFPTIWTFLGHAFPRFAWLGPPLACAGLYLGAKDRQERKTTLILGFALGLYIITFSALSNLETKAELFPTIVGRFCIQSDFMIAIAAGLGFAKLLPWLHARFPFLDRRPHLVFGFPILVLLIGVVAHHSTANQRNNRVFPDFVKTAFASLPENAIVITYGDHVNGAVAYFHEVENLRPDVIHLDRELLSHPWYGQRKRKLHPDLFLPQGGYGRHGWKIKQLLDGNPVRPLIVIDQLDTWDESWMDGYKLYTQGLVYTLVPISQSATFEEWALRDREAKGLHDVTPALRNRKGTWENALGQLMLTTQGLRAHIAMVYSIERGKDPVAARLCATLIEDIIAKAGGDHALGIPGTPGLPRLLLNASAWKDLGVCYEILARVEPAYGQRVPIAVQRFAERAQSDDTALPAARKYLETRRARPIQNSTNINMP